MSTRCAVVVRDTERDSYQNIKVNERTYIYHHHDGHMEGVGKDLGETLSKYVRDKNSQVNFQKVVDVIKNIDDEYEEIMAMPRDVEYVYVVDVDSKDYNLPFGITSSPSVSITGYKTKHDYNPDVKEFTPMGGYIELYCQGFFQHKTAKPEKEEEDTLMDSFGVKSLSDEQLKELHAIVMKELVKRNCI